MSILKAVHYPQFTSSGVLHLQEPVAIFNVLGSISKASPQMCGPEIFLKRTRKKTLAFITYHRHRKQPKKKTGHTPQLNITPKHNNTSFYYKPQVK